MVRKKDFEQVLKRAFDQYSSTSELLREWLSKRRNMQEFVILACARLDSLSNLAFPEGAQENNFLRFLTTYSTSRRDLEKVSLPDLYFFVNFHEWALPGVVSKPGHLHMFEPKRDRDLISLLWHSGVPITERDVGRLIRFLLRQLKEHWRVVPNQSLNKPSYDTTKSIRQKLKSAAGNYKNEYYSKAVDLIGPVLDKYKLAALLYREYRCGAIHEYKVDLDEPQFFTKRKPYWSTIWSTVATPSGFLRLRFPGPFLLELLDECARNYKANLSNRKKLPVDVFYEYCDIFDDMDYLDEDSIPSGKEISPNI
jgi:hypothetical protein